MAAQPVQRSAFVLSVTQQSCDRDRWPLSSSFQRVIVDNTERWTLDEVGRIRLCPPLPIPSHSLQVWRWGVRIVLDPNQTDSLMTTATTMKVRSIYLVQIRIVR
ncbi:hypothetical protein MUK42_37117 [Musa troglodytarum]|uniref:Uncharacterized protein n=1 Tax=Musa troglodytarum TaxID=320322 RepID=A0A9E7EEA4_9LILI|nr:hypothetical protein MUK42_37117 [Musa troglodytarum]